MERMARCETFKAIKLLSYAIFAMLLIAAFFFAGLIILQFLEGSTYFSIAQKPISKDDLPTVTICSLSSREIVYGRDFDIQTLFNYTNCENTNCNKTTLFSLKEGRNEYDFQLGRKDLTFLRVLKVQHRHAAYPFRNCVALDLSVRELDSAIKNEGIGWDGIGYEGYGVSKDLTVTVNLNGEKLEYYNIAFFIVNFFDNLESDDIHQVTAYFTTRRNSYGAAYFQWHDGVARPFDLRKGIYQTVNYAN